MKNKLFFVFIFSICMMFSFSFAECQHSGGNHENGGVCEVCGEIYQTHGLDVENINIDDDYHWYKCSYNGCGHVYDKVEHTKTMYVNSDLTYHWYRCKLTDCPYKFESQKHYGGNDNDGYCEFKLCNKLYVAKLQINEYEYLEYKVGDKDKLTAIFVPEDVEVPKIESGYKWKSSMTNVVTIDDEGNIEALKDGVATISVTYGTYSAKCVIVVGDLEFSVEPDEYKLHVNEQGTGKIDVTHKEKGKDVNINQYVDFDAFKWDKDILKVNIKKEKENEILFRAINESSDVINVDIWLNNKLRIIEEKVEKSLMLSTTLYSKDELQYLKQQVENEDKEFSDEELTEFEDGIKEDKIKVKDEIYKVKKYVKVMIYIIPSETSVAQSPTQSSGQQPGQSPTQSSGQQPVQSPIQTFSPNPEISPEQSPDKNPTKSPGQSPSPEPVSSPKKEEVVEGPGHEPVEPVEDQETGTVNRRHVCNTDGYFPDPEDPESGHLRRCYYPECEYYKKGIPGTKAEHRWKYNSDKEVNMCIICYYEQGSGMTEPQKIHSRDFGIDVLQSQFFVIKDEETEVDVIITGVEDDLAIRYGSVYDNDLKWTEGRKDNNCITLKWDIKDEYAREAFDVNFEKRDDERIITVELKEGYIQPTRTEVDITVENNFGEKRLETIELIKEAPERAQFILRFTGDIINSIEVGETKEITVLCKSQYGYGNADRKEVQEYYESKDLVDYEDIQLTWEGTGGITASGASSPDSDGFAKGQVTGVSVTDGQSAELIITATAKYENEDLIDEVERELKRGIYVYENSSSSSSGQQSSSGSSGSQSTGGSSQKSSGSQPTGGSSQKSSALPIAAVSMGLLAIGGVAFAVNSMTKR